MEVKMKSYPLFITTSILFFLLLGCQERTDIPSAPIAPASTATIESPATITPAFLLSEELTTITTEFNNLTVTVSYPKQAPMASDARLFIDRNDFIVYDDKLFPGIDRGHENDFAVMTIESPGIYNLDEDSDLEIVVHVLSDGPYCCGYTAIMDYDSTRGLYFQSTRKKWGTFRNLPKYSDEDDNGVLELITRNEDFSSTFGPYAVSGAAPLQVWEYTVDGLQDRTRDYPDLIREDAEFWWQQYTDKASVWFGHRSALSAHIANQCILRAETIDWVQAEEYYDPGTRSGNKPWDRYLATLKKALKNHGYACSLSFSLRFPPIITMDDVYLEGPDISYDGISFSIPTTLGGGVCVTTLDAPGGIGFSFACNGTSSGGGWIEIYPLESYQDFFPNGIDIDELRTAIDAKSRDFSPKGYFSAIFLQAKTEYIPAKFGAGIRAIVMRTQIGIFANSESAEYDFRGLTADGKYYIGVQFPIDAPILLSAYDPTKNVNPGAISIPEIPDDLPPFQLGDIQLKYNDEIERQLNQLADLDFTPDLSALDKLVASLQVSSR